MQLPVNYNELSPHQRRKVREEYVELQKGACCFCGCPLIGEPRSDIACKKIYKILFPPNFFNYPVHLHHNHTSGMTIGAVHNYCNAVMWQYYQE